MYVVHHFNTLVSFFAGAYNIGGSPEPAVAEIKNMIYMNHTSEGEAQSREEHLGGFYVLCMFDSVLLLSHYIMISSVTLLLNNNA